jgi:hypothetical protein
MEDYRGFKAMSRSRRLVEGFWWRTFGLIFLAGLLTAVFTVVLQIILAALFFTSESEAVLVIGNGLAQVIASTITTPVTAAVTAVMYFDLRVRKEGFDLELMARTMGAPPPAFPSSGYGGQGYGGSPWDQPPPPPPGTPWDQPPPPPPPGNQPPGGQPPYWPPPPGWRPPGEGG